MKEYQLIFSDKFNKSLGKIDHAARIPILEKISVLKEDPFRGEPLKGKLSGLYKLVIKVRKVSYRAIYSIEKDGVIVFVGEIRKREDVYKILKRRK